MTTTVDLLWHGRKTAAPETNSDVKRNTIGCYARLDAERLVAEHEAQLSAEEYVAERICATAPSF